MIRRIQGGMILNAAVLIVVGVLGQSLAITNFAQAEESVQAPAHTQASAKTQPNAKAPKSSQQLGQKQHGKVVELGKILFFDPRLSRTGTVSCNSCHNVMSSGTDNRSFSLGFSAQPGGRNAPSVWNAKFMSVQFWDGRAASLEDQAKGPITNPVEMGAPNHGLVIERLKKVPEYVTLFEDTFGKENPITIDNVAHAIAEYERTLESTDSDFDQFLKGKKKAITERQKKGYELVQSVGCVACHNGPHFAGPQLPVGQGFYQRFPTFPNADLENKFHFTKDLGRFEATKQDADKNMWRVASWRNVALTGPYFHNGSVKTLGEAVKVMAKLQLNRDLSDSEIGDIVEFLKSLTGRFSEQKMPRIPFRSEMEENYPDKVN